MTGKDNNSEHKYRDVTNGGGEYIRVEEVGRTDKEPLVRVRCTSLGAPCEEAYIYPDAEYTLKSEPGPDGYTVETNFDMDQSTECSDDE